MRNPTEVTSERQRSGEGGTAVATAARAVRALVCKGTGQVYTL